MLAKSLLEVLRDSSMEQIGYGKGGLHKKRENMVGEKEIGWSNEHNRNRTEAKAKKQKGVLETRLRIGKEKYVFNQ